MKLEDDNEFDDDDRSTQRSSFDSSMSKRNIDSDMQFNNRSSITSTKSSIDSNKPHLAVSMMYL